MADTELLRQMYFSMLRIRRVQERIESEYLEDRMKTPVHLCIGQEAISTGVCAALKKEDYISSNHRGHGHYLAKGGDLNALIAELHCKETGCSKGRGGSMHLVDVSVGHLGSSSIVGGGIPIGTGLGLAIQMQQEKKVSVVFFGDGAADEGVLYESLNFAMLKKLPVIFVLESNGYSVCSPTAARQAGKNVFLTGADPDLLLTASVDGNDAMAVYEFSQKAVDRARNGLGPAFADFATYRILGHAGCAAQDASGYRQEEEIREWKEKDPIVRLEKTLKDKGGLKNQDIEEMEKTIGDELDAAFAFAQKSPLPKASGLYDYLMRNP